MNAEQLLRIELMATGDPTWDLSENDIEAIKAILAERTALREALSALIAGLEDTNDYLVQDLSVNALLGLTKAHTALRGEP